MSTTVRSSYRGLLRATGIAFKNDLKTLGAARQKMREEYTKSDVTADLSEQIQHAKDVAKFLRSNIVQGSKQAEKEDDAYTLNIHKDTELGDNETIKEGGKRNTLTGVKGSAPKKCKS